MKKLEDNNFFQFISNNLQEYEPKCDQKVSEQNQSQFLSELTQDVQHFKTQGPIKVDYQINEFNESQIIQQFQPTFVKEELQQQKRILQLYQKIHTLNQNINRQKQINQELLFQTQAQQKCVEINQQATQSFETTIIELAKKQKQLQNQIQENELLLKQLKPIVQIMVDAMNKEQISIAKKAQMYKDTLHSQHMKSQQKSQSERTSRNQLTKNTK